jgi:hypothetical protein
MMVVVGCFDEGPGEQRIIAFPAAWSIGWEDSHPPWIVVVQLDRTAGQQKVVDEWRIAQ